MSRARLGGVLAAVLLGTAAGPVATAPAAQAASGYCTKGTGVTVVVDNGAAGGGTSVRCDPGGAGAPGSTVVPRAGYPLTYVTRQPGFVCRVAGRPASAPCQNTPPATAYWGLFWSDGRSGAWNYSNVGIGSLKVPAGGFIGFRWQTGGRTVPGPAPVAPAAARPTPAPKPSPRPSSRPTPRPTPPPDSKPSRTATSRPADTGAPSSAPRTTGPSDRPDASGGGTTAGSPTRTAAPRASTGPRDKPTGKAGKAGKPGKPGSRASSTPSPSDPASTDSSAAAAAGSAPSDEAAPATDVDLASGEQGTDPVLTLAAGGLLVLLLGAVGVLAWRRRT